MGFYGVNNGEMEIESLKDLGKSFFFVGCNLDYKLVRDLELSNHKTSDIDFKSAEKNNLRNELSKIDFSGASRNFDTLVIHELCLGSADIILKTLTSFYSFNNIAIKFCNDMDHYDFNYGDIYDTAEYVAKVLAFRDFIVRGSSDGLSYVLYASKSKEPVVYSKSISPLSFVHPHGFNEPSPFEDDWA